MGFGVTFLTLEHLFNVTIIVFGVKKKGDATVGMEFALEISFCVTETFREIF